MPMGIEVEIDLGDVYGNLYSHEYKQLAKWLHEDGHLTEYIRDYNKQSDRSNQLTDDSFVTDCVSLGEAFYRMSDADIQIVRDMVNKYKYH